jgi:DNA-binding LytR/AlgR family response regulator
MKPCPKNLFMNMWIVEKDKKQLRTLVKILKFLDPSINILRTFTDLTTMKRELEVSISPRLVLVNQDLVPKENTAFPDNAKIILPTKEHTLIYLAFCVNIAESSDSSFFLEPISLSRLNELEEEGAEGEDKSGSVKEMVQTKAHKTRFLVMQGQKFLSVPVENISYFFSDDRFVFFMTFDKQKFLVEYKMEELQQLLNSKMFFRVNRSFIVSINSLEAIHPYFGSRFKLKLTPATKKEIIVSRERTGSFKAWLGE